MCETPSYDMQAVLDTAAAQREARLFEDAAAGRGGPGAAPAQVRAAVLVRAWSPYYGIANHVHAELLGYRCRSTANFVWLGL